MEVAPFVSPDLKQAIQFFACLFPKGGLVHFRAVPEPKDARAPTNHFYELDGQFPATLGSFLDYCRAERRAAFFLPGTSKPGATGKDGVTSVPAVLVDLDKGDPQANLLAAIAEIGEPTIVIESGGTTETGSPKLHAYWVLQEAATSDAIGELCRVREALALKFGGDTAFKQPAQVIRIPGSIHFKGAPKLVRLRGNIGTRRYNLDAFRSLGVIAASSKSKLITFADFTNPGKFKPQSDTVDRALTAPVHAEGKDEITRFEAASAAIGHWVRMVREGRKTEDEAWRAVRDWNMATLVPPWEDDRLRREFEALLTLDRKNNPAPVVPEPPPAGYITSWRADRFKGPPPPRVWTVKGVLPAATAGVLAAVGDAGKSMLTLKLGLDIAIGSAARPHFFGGEVSAQGAVAIVTAEDDAAEVHRRLHSLDPTNMREGKPLYVVPMISAGGAKPIMVESPNGPMPTEFWAALAQQLAAIPDLRLVVFDPLSIFVAGDTNDNTLGAALMAESAKLASATGATFMWVHHFNKGKVPTSLSDARESIRGAGALVDNARWALVLWEADEDDAHKALKKLGQENRASTSGLVYRGGLAKSNAPGAKKLRTFVRDASTGLLQDTTEAVRTVYEDEDAKVLTALRDMDTNDGRFDFPKSRKALDTDDKLEPLKAKTGLTERDIEAAIGRLITNGKIKRTDDKTKVRYCLVH